MKKILFVLFSLFLNNISAQVVTVSSASTAQQLANNIVNPNCVTTSNWVVKGAQDYGMPSSVGTFSKNGSTFPMNAGVVLTTGFLNSVPGPINTSSTFFGEGNNPLWVSDADMDTALGVANLSNASSLEFEFNSQKNVFNLDYIFASYEYGNRQCNPQANDATVILLTDLVTNVTTNITPLLTSVNNIRNNANNTSCASSNATSFGQFYGSSPSTSPVNFYGRTIALTATANIIIGRQYKLKIVVADRTDFQFDCAVFIKSYSTVSTNQSFLGNDLTLANNSALCEGQPHTIVSGLSNPSYTYSWKKDGAPISGANTPDYVIPSGQFTGTHTYTLTVNLNSCDVADIFIDNVTIEYAPVFAPTMPENLYKCSTTTSVNLGYNTPIVGQGLSFTPVVTYHTDAACITTALPLTYTGNATTIYVKIIQPGNPCPVIKQFSIITLSDPFIANVPANITPCAASTGSQIARTNLQSLVAEILGTTQSSSIYGVTFHTTQPNANTGSSPISMSSNGNANVSSGPIFIRVFIKSNPTCFVTSSFQVTILPLQAADQPLPVVYCGTPGYTLPSLANGKYFTNQYVEGTPNSQLPEIPAGTVITIPTGYVGTYTTTIFVSNLVTTANPCTQEWPLMITLIQPSTFTETDKTVCDSYTLPGLANGDYYTGPNGTGTIIPGGTALTSTTTVYFNFTSAINEPPLNPECSVPAGPATITIENKPNIGPDRLDVFTCNPPYILPSLAAYPGAQYFNNANGTGTPIPSGTPINTTQTIHVVQFGTGSLMCKALDSFSVQVGALNPIANVNQCNYTLPAIPVGNYYNYSHYAPPPANPLQFPAGYQVPSSMTIWVYVPPLTGEVCAPGQNETSFTVTLSQPTLVPMANFVSPSCDPIDLPVLTGGGKYYTGSHGSGGTGGTEITLPYTVSTNQTIYAYNFNPGSVPLCDIEYRYDFVINPRPTLAIDNPFPENCNSNTYILPVLSTGNYYTGTNGTGTVLNTLALRTIAGPNPSTVYAYISNSVTGCSTEKIIRISFGNTVADVPPNPIEEACTSYTLPNLVAAGAKYHSEYWVPTDPNNTTPNPPSSIIITNPVWTMPDPTQTFYDHTVYVYNSTLDGVRETCAINNPLRIILYKQPNLGNPGPMYFCGVDSITGADLPVTTGKYYTASHLAGGTGGTEITPTTVISSTQRVYVYEMNPSIIPGSTFPGCFDEKSFMVNLFNIDTVSDLTGCGSITLPTTARGNYFNSPGGVSPVTNTTIANTGTTPIVRTIYLYASSGFPASSGCTFIERPFMVTIAPIPTANPVPVADRTFCDTYLDNDGIFDVNLTQFDATILGTQTDPEFSISYHESAADALANTGAVTNSILPTVYAVVHNSNFPDCNSQPYQLDLIINKLPEVTPETQYLCFNNITNLPIGTVTLDSGLNPANYIFEWTDSTNVTVGSSSTYTTNVVDNYTLTVTANDLSNPLNNCVSVPVVFSVLPSSIAITAFTITEDFADVQNITIVANGPDSNYSYQLDGGLFQLSNVFYNVDSGLHTVIVRDNNGCGDSPPIDIIIINYPKYFTPNGDNYHDTWNIHDLSLLGDPTAIISIFDRQGKLLKQISPNSESGWDGKFNGNELPSTDYWFRVNYVNQGIAREFKAHFSMKR